jgi:hypothetical protein
METTVIMELPKDLRRRIFPRCHVSSLPGIKLPVVNVALRYNAHVDAAIWTSEIKVKTTVIMDSCQDLRRGIFPC